MRFQVRSMALLSGLRIWCCHELWCRLAATALIQPLAWDLPYATDTALKWQKKKKKIVSLQHLGHCCGEGSIPGLGTLTCCVLAKKKKKKERKKENKIALCKDFFFPLSYCHLSVLTTVISPWITGFSSSPFIFFTKSRNAIKLKIDSHISRLIPFAVSTLLWK